MSSPLYVITGATGHIGYALLKKLTDRGERVRILIRKDTPVFDGIECEKAFGDVTNPDTLDAAFEGADVVFHLAGIIDINVGNEEMIWKVNFEGTKNVVRAVQRCGVKRLVYASSVDAFIPLPDNQIMRETDSFDVTALDGTYAKTKAAATNLILHTVRTENLDAVIVFPGACIGPYDFKVSNAGEMVRMSMHGSFPASLNFGAYNFVDVRDVADGMIAAAEKADPAKVTFFAVSRLRRTALSRPSPRPPAKKRRASAWAKASSRLRRRSRKSITRSASKRRCSRATRSASSPRIATSRSTKRAGSSDTTP